MAIDVIGLFSIPIWLAVGIVLFTAFCIYRTWNFTYWSSQGVPTDNPWPIVGSLGKRFILKQTMHDYDNAVYKKVGPIWGTIEGRKPELLVADPDLLKSILIKDFNYFVDRRDPLFDLGDPTFERMLTSMKGEDWKQTRNILTPTFTSGKLKQMSNFMEEAAQKLMNNLEKSDAVKEGMNLQPKYSAYTLDIIANCAFGIQINSYDDNDQFVLYVKDFFNLKFNLKLILLLLFPFLGKIMDLSILPMKSFSALKMIIKDVIQKRRKEETKRNDFLQLLLDAQIEEKQLADMKTTHATGNKILTEDTVIAQCMLFLLAGFDTVSATLNFVFYVLALHEECQQKLIKEIDNAIEEHGSLGYDAIIMNLQYLDMVISETLRLYPVATRIERKCTKDYTLGKILLKEGMMVGIPVYPMHHDEKLYPDPEVFNPERFSAANKHLMKGCSYLPFGSGPRNCIGLRFAMMEMKIAIAYTLRNFTVEKTDKTLVPLEFLPNVALLKPKEGKEIIIRLVKREHCK